MSDRRLIAANRSGTNWLRVETGQWNKEKLEDRVCRMCSSASVEDEEHFLLHCEVYESQRRRMVDEIRAIPLGI